MTSLTSSGSDTDALTYTTASISPTGSRLVLAAVASTALAANLVAPVLTGNGLNWITVDSVTFNTAAVPTMQVRLFRAMVASPTAGAVTIDFSATQTRCIWSFAEFAGVDTSGVDGAGAVVQSAFNQTDAATSLIATLVAFGSVNNATYGCFGCAVNEVQTVGTGFTVIHDQSPGVEAMRLLTEWRNDNDTTVDSSSATSTARGAVGVEIKAAPLAGPFGRYWWFF